MREREKSLSPLPAVGLGTVALRYLGVLQKKKHNITPQVHFPQYSLSIQKSWAWLCNIYIYIKNCVNYASQYSCKIHGKTLSTSSDDFTAKDETLILLVTVM